MPLVTPLAIDANQEVAELAKFFNETLGYCPNSVLTMQRRPAIASAFIQLNMAVMENKGRLTSEQKRLIGYVTSLAAGCRYCQAHTIRAARRYGGDDDRLQQVWDYQNSPLFSDSEQAALDFAVAATVVPNGVTEEISDRLREHWDDGEIIEILGVVSLFGFLNRWNDSMATTLEEPAAEDGERYLSNADWTRGKHVLPSKKGLGADLRGHDRLE